MNGELLLPPGARLLHIGPFKTGSTTLQAAFHQNRDSLRRQGVEYPSRGEQPMVAVMAASSGLRLPGRSSVGLDRWRRLARDVRAAGSSRTVVSSEFFCETREENVAAILQELGGEQVQVVVTLRPLVRILPSQWQQYAQNQKVISYPDWLDAVLNRPEDRSVTPSFWLRHRHDRLVRRWADIAGPDHLTVVAVDQGDPQMLLRTFEQLLGLEPQTLVPRDVGGNRSLTFPEVEMLREFNRRYRDQKWSAADYTRLVRFGAVRHLQRRRPDPGEPRPLTPQWAVDAANEVAAEMVREIRACGVRIVGDLDAMVDPGAAAATGDNLPHPDVPVDAAARFCAGLVEQLDAIPPEPVPQHLEAGPFEATMRARGEARGLEKALRVVDARIATAQARSAAAAPLADHGGRALLGELGRRVRHRRRTVSSHD